MVDSVLLVGFGGPVPGCCKGRDPCPGEAYCFVHAILPPAPDRDERAREVAAHYALLGGFSPYNEHTFEQARALEAALAARGRALPVFVGFKNWMPSLESTLEEMAKQGRRELLAIVMAAHRSTASYDKYLKALDAARASLGARAPALAGYVEGWSASEGFVAANAARILEVTRGWDRARFEAAALVFAAHSIPVAAARSSPYVSEIETSAKLIAARLKKADFTVAWQSAPAHPSIPWLSPMVRETVERLPASGKKDAIVAPIGFLCDHVEVLYDLDHDARAGAEAAGVGFFRAPTVGSHPAFVGMLADLVVARL